MTDTALLPPRSRAAALARTLLERVLPSLAGVLFALLVGALLVLAAGKSPARVAATFAKEFYSADAGNAVFFATVYALTGLAVAHSFQAGLFNIGGEGQLLMGGFCLGLVGAALPAETPTLVALPVCLVAAFVGGALWALVPAVLRARLGVHEVLTTILMNLIAPAVTIFGLGLYRKSHPDLAEAVHTLDVVPGARLSLLERWIPAFEASDASTAVVLALTAAALLAWHLQKTRSGYELRAVGLNPEAAHAAGVPVRAVLAKALLVSGGIAGLAAVPFVLGSSSKHYYEQGMLAGAGFTGIAVAVLAGNQPLRVLIAATLLGFLTQAGQVVNGSGPEQISKEIVQVLQAVVILAVLVAQNVAHARLRLRAAREQRA